VTASYKMAPVMDLWQLLCEKKNSMTPSLQLAS